MKDFLLKMRNFIDPGKKKWIFFVNIGVRIEPLCDRTITAGLKLMCPSFLELNYDNFPLFFWFLCRPKNERVRAL